MDPADILIVVAAFLGAAVPIGLGSAWYFAHRRAKELESQLQGSDFAPDDRLEALERSVATLADQVEQIASGQEFLNRLVATQLERPGASSARESTPH